MSDGPDRRAGDRRRLDERDEARLFERCDEPEGNTLLVFSDTALALRYIAHRQALGNEGLIAMVEDTRERTGLCVLCRDPVPAGEVSERQANCRWLLEEVLAGRIEAPVAGEARTLWQRGSRPTPKPTGS